MNNAGVAALGYPGVLAEQEYEIELIRKKLEPQADAPQAGQSAPAA